MTTLPFIMAGGTWFVEWRKGYESVVIHGDSCCELGAFARFQVRKRKDKRRISIVVVTERIMEFDWKRRNLLWQCSVVGLGFTGLDFTIVAKDAPDKSEEKEPEVTATEDLMREHGVIRRALLLYYELVPKLRKDVAGVDASALKQTAQLFRTFGEDYHERMLEEQHI